MGLSDFNISVCSLCSDAQGGANVAEAHGCAERPWKSSPPWRSSSPCARLPSPFRTKTAAPMSQKIYKVPEDFAALAHLKAADYQRLYQESVRDPNGFWARIGRRLDWIQPLLQGQGHELRRTRLSHSLVLRRQAQRLRQLSRSSSDASAATRPPSSGKATIRGSPSGSPIASCTSASASARMR